MRLVKASGAGCFFESEALGSRLLSIGVNFLFATAESGIPLGYLCVIFILVLPLKVKKKQSLFFPGFVVFLSVHVCM